MMSNKRPVCAFCGKNQNEVSTIIAGAHAFICDECVALCVGIIKDKGRGTGLEKKIARK